MEALLERIASALERHTEQQEEMIAILRARDELIASRYAAEEARRKEASGEE